MNIYLNIPFSRIMMRTILCILPSGITVNVIAQKPETAIEQQFDTYRKNALQEKMFVHTDKEFYLGGEICWFKVYAVDAFFHKPIDLSKVAYAELLDNTNKPVIQAKIAMEKAIGNGSVYIPVTINSGNYKLRVYTSWMKNFSADYFFEKQISIVNTQVNTQLPVNDTTPSFDIQFFPEGGNLVNGLQSKVAFRVVNKYGKGVDCNAVVVNNLQDTVSELHTLKFGIGNFNIKPVAGQQYKAVFTMPGGIRVSKELPVAYSYGFVMRLVPEGERHVKVLVQFVADEREPAPMSVYLFAHTRGSVKESLRAPFENGIATFMIDKDKLGDGISHFTIFNSSRQPVCERLFFKPLSNKLTVKIKTDADIYDTRKKISLRIDAADQWNNPVVADMSMAVYRVDSLQLPVQSGISEYLWLCSDLPGYIESPEYYLNTTGAETSEAIDNLVLTNGWRRFKWEDILQNKKPVFKFAPEYNGHMITGRIVNNKTGAASENINAYLSAPGTTRFRTSLSDKNGNVKFEMQHFYGTPGIIVQTDTETDSVYHVEIDDPFSNQFATRPVAPFLLPVNNPGTLLQQSISMQVENIFNGDIRKKVKVEMIDTIGFFHHPNETYLLDNYTRFTTMEEVLREYIISVNVRKRQNRYFLPVYNDGETFNELFQNNPLVLLDGVPVFNMDKIMQYDPLKVRKLETVTRRYFYGKTINDGIINIVTYNGNLEGFELDPQATVIDYEALQLQREFYSPVYETAQQAASHQPDFRTLLNWSPGIKTDVTGKYQLPFYSSDVPGKYVVVVQALTADGKTASSNLFFEVKKPSK